MTPEHPAPPTGYWYRDKAVMELLGALREFRRADEAMRSHLSVDLGVNPLDLRALQLVIAAQREQQPLSPGDLSQALRITSAATTKLVDRLVASGHVHRTPHAHDRRSVVLGATAHAHDVLRRRMGPVHERMGQVASAVPPESRAAITAFLTSMSLALQAGRADVSARTSPRG